MAIAHGRPVEQEATVEEFFRWPTDERVEWVRGKVVRMSPVNIQHWKLVRWFTMLFGALGEELGGEVFAENIAMRDEKGGVYRCPDIMFVLPEHLDRVKPTMLEGPADLIIEVVSPDSVSRDRGEKYVEYEALGVLEYWIIDPDRQVAEFHRLEDGRYRMSALDDGAYRSSVLPQVVIKEEWLWQEKLPPTKKILQLWGL